MVSQVHRTIDIPHTNCHLGFLHDLLYYNNVLFFGPVFSCFYHNTHNIHAQQQQSGQHNWNTGTVYSLVSE